MIKDSALPFLSKITNLLKDNSIDIKNWEIDHLCYRTDSLENYSEVKEYFSEMAELLIESEVGGRPIATYKLHEPLIFENFIINLIEVPAPKAGRISQKGFEHIEVVIDCPFSQLVDEYPKIGFITKGLKKDLNPELEIEFSECAVKFHHKSLEHIIAIEKNSRITKFLEETKILTELKEFSPCISGTLPLSISTDQSNLDILFTAIDFKIFQDQVTLLFGHFPNFTVKETTHQNQAAIVINFTFQELPIEIFANKTEVFTQQANRHFLVEGRILKIAGEEFRKAVIELKKAGLKTEPAFGKLLKLEQPYEDLLELSFLNDKELKERLKI